MIYDSAKYRNFLEREKGKKAQVDSDLQEYVEGVKQIGRDIRKNEEALEIVKYVGLRTQEQLQYRISDIASMALSAVFENPYELVAEFVQRRNKTECDLFFQRDGEKIDPLNASGGGAVDIASFALRTASWAMNIPRTSDVLLLDEPFRYVSEDLISKTGEILQKIADELGLQFVIVTHEEALMDFADVLYEVQQNKKGVSHVDKIKKVSLVDELRVISKSLGRQKFCKD